MSVSVPARCFAIAAEAAVRSVGGEVADVFDDGRPSRARLVAIEAVRRVFPLASRVEIARCFGLDRTGREVARMVESAFASSWWSDDVVLSVAGVILSDLRWPLLDAFARVEAVEIGALARADEPDPVAQRWSPRKVRPARLVTVTARPRSVTAALLGDPPPGRRAALEAMPSPLYTARQGNPTTLRRMEKRQEARADD